MRKFSHWLLDDLAAEPDSKTERTLWAMQQVLDFIEEGVVVHDPDRRIFLFNRAAEQITGWSRAEVVGHDCREVFGPDGICGSRCRFPPEAEAERPQPDTHEVDFTDRRGAPRRIQVRITHLDLQPVRPPAVLATIRDVTEVSQLRWQMREKYSFHGMVGRSAAMREVFATIRQVTHADYPVLITGESGTGKELVARAIHNESRRAAGPFVPINCGALPVNILESELFGHVRGAFTGAIRDKKGRFELADRGTLFLDEVGELEPAFQVKLLRVLQEMSFEPVGGERQVKVDVRIISATNKDPKQLVDQGTFRQDLYYRLSVVPVHLPPLRDRQADLPMLTEQILASVRQETGKQVLALGQASMDRLLAYAWPGNVRELINALQFAAIRCEGEQIQPAHLPPEVREARPGPRADSPARPRGRRSKLTAEAVERALEQASGNKVKAARLLGVGRATLYRFLDRHGSK